MSATISSSTAIPWNPNSLSPTSSTTSLASSTASRANWTSSTPCRSSISSTGTIRWLLRSALWVCSGRALDPSLSDDMLGPFVLPKSMIREWECWGIAIMKSPGSSCGRLLGRKRARSGRWMLSRRFGGWVRPRKFWRWSGSRELLNFDLRLGGSDDGRSMMTFLFIHSAQWEINYGVHITAVCSHVLSPLCVGWKFRAGLKNGDEKVYFNAQRRGVHIPTLILRLLRSSWKKETWRPPVYQPWRHEIGRRDWFVLDFARECWLSRGNNGKRRKKRIVNMSEDDVTYKQMFIYML